MMFYHICLHLYSDMSTYELYTLMEKNIHLGVASAIVLRSFLELVKCTGCGVYRKYDKNIVGPTPQAVLAICRMYSTPKFCKSCEFIVN